MPTGKKTIRGTTPCFADRVGARTAAGITATVYRVNQDADQWHILLAWQHDGSLYTVSEHVIKPYTYTPGREEPRPAAASLVLVQPTGLMRLTRRRFLGGAAAAAVGGAGIYELVDQLVGRRRRVRPPAPTPPREQHVFDLEHVESEGVEVLVPPLHSEIVTATLKVDDLRAAQHDLEHALRELDARYAPTPPGSASRSPGGCRTSSSASRAQAKAHLPFDRRARQAGAAAERAASRATRTTTILEQQRRRGAAAQRQPRAHRRRAQGALRRPRRSSR